MPHMRGSITEEDRSFTETWENIAPSQNAVIRLDNRGDERPEVISGPRKFMITTEERLITQEKIVSERLDPFRNGAFRPVVVPDTITVESNPNALSDDEIRQVFASSELAWAEWLKVIDSPETLRRMVDLADSSDISLRRFKEVAARLAQVKPRTRVSSKDDQLEKFLGSDRVEPQTSPSEQGKAPRREQGGRSRDYREQ